MPNFTSAYINMKQLIWFVLLFFFLIFAIFNASLFRSETFVITSRAALSEVSSETSVKGEGISLQSIKLLAALKVDFDFLKSEEFSSLAINGDIPIKPQAEGRANPFLPY